MTPADLNQALAPPARDKAGTEAEIVARERDRVFHAAAPIALVIAGAFLGLASGAVFVYPQVEWITGAWAITLLVGLASAGTGLWLRGRPELGERGHAIAVAADLLLVLHGVGYAVAARDPLVPILWVSALLLGSGYVLLRTRDLAVVVGAAVVAWIGGAYAVGLPLVSETSGALATGVAFALATQAAHRQRLRSHIQLVLTTEGTLHASEERFRSLAETAKDAILLLDAQGRLTYLNPAGTELFGIKPEDVPGRFLSQHLGIEGLDPGAAVGMREVSAQRRDGTRFPAELSLARTEREGVVAYTGILRDITERKRSIDAARRVETKEAEVARLREMNEFKTRFLNMAAHELNTPLTPLRLQLHLLKNEQMGPLNERQAKAMELLDRNVNRLSGLVGELLEVARLQSGRLRLQVVPIALDGIIDEVLGSFEEAARRVGVDVRFEGDQNLSAQADRNRTTQVLVNLVSNAIKFTPSGGSVTVSAKEEKDRIVVRVRDTGLGLEPDQQARLFQPFTQVHDPMAITASGTGLGLYISRGLLEAQGGTIEVESAGAGKGSTFTFTLLSAKAAPVRPAVVRPAEEDPIARRLRELI